jgi:hypothetical protein
LHIPVFEVVVEEGRRRKRGEEGREGGRGERERED